MIPKSKDSVGSCHGKLRGQHCVFCFYRSPGRLHQDLIAVSQGRRSFSSVCEAMEPVFRQAVIAVDPGTVLHKSGVDIFYDVPDRSHADRSQDMLLPVRSRPDLEDTASRNKDGHRPSP